LLRKRLPKPNRTHRGGLRPSRRNERRTRSERKLAGGAGQTHHDRSYGEGTSFPPPLGQNSYLTELVPDNALVREKVALCRRQVKLKDGYSCVIRTEICTLYDARICEPVVKCEWTVMGKGKPRIFLIVSAVPCATRSPACKISDRAVASGFESRKEKRPIADCFSQPVFCFLQGCNPVVMQPAPIL
jgi:hypothetical protein